MIHYQVKVTILILIDGFLQYIKEFIKGDILYGHNPYFNRWFSAIMIYQGRIAGVALSQSLF